MNTAAFVIATPVGYSGVVRSARICERRASRRHAAPVASVAIATTGSAGSVGPSYMDETNENDDGGDGFFGDPGDLNASLGIPMPPMSKEERNWFLSAPSEPSRLDRLKEIAKRRHNEQLMAQMKANVALGDIYRANSAESYMDSLARQSAENETRRLEALGLTPPKPKGAPAEPPSESPQRISTIDFLEAKRAGMNAGERYMDELRTGGRGAPAKPEEKADDSSKPKSSQPPKGEFTQAMPFASKPKDPATPTSSNPSATTPSGATARPKNGFDEQNVAEKDSRAAQNKPVDPELKGPLSAPEDTNTLDKQIAFLEQHLSKLQEAEAKDASASSKDLGESTQSKPKVNGMSKDLGIGGASPSKGMGELSAEETRNVFEQIRDARSAGMPSPLDPLARSLPERRGPDVVDPDDVSLGDGPEEMTEAQIRAKFEEVRRQNRESLPGGSTLPVPTESTSQVFSEDRVRNALLALRQEHKKYIDASRRTLEAYERNLDDIIARHMPE